MKLTKKLFKKIFWCFFILLLGVMIFKEVYPLRVDVEALSQKRISFEKLPPDVANVMELSITKQEESLKGIKGYEKYSFDDLVNLDHDKYEVEYSANYGGPFTKHNWFNIKHYRFKEPMNTINSPFVFKNYKLYCRYKDDSKQMIKFVEIDLSGKLE